MRVLRRAETFARPPTLHFQAGVVGRPAPPASPVFRRPGPAVTISGPPWRTRLVREAARAAAPAAPGNPLTAAAGRRRRAPAGINPRCLVSHQVLDFHDSKILYTAGPFFSTAWHEASGINTQRFSVIQLTERNTVHLSDQKGNLCTAVPRSMACVGDAGDPTDMATRGVYVVCS